MDNVDQDDSGLTAVFSPENPKTVTLINPEDPNSLRLQLTPNKGRGKSLGRNTKMTAQNMTNERDKRYLQLPSLLSGENIMEKPYVNIRVIFFMIYENHYFKI